MKLSSNGVEHHALVSHFVEQASEEQAPNGPIVNEKTLCVFQRTVLDKIYSNVPSDRAAGKLIAPSFDSARRRAEAVLRCIGKFADQKR